MKAGRDSLFECLPTTADPQFVTLIGRAQAALHEVGQLAWELQTEETAERLETSICGVIRDLVEYRSGTSAVPAEAA